MAEHVSIGPTPLYPIAPRAVGTADVESLTGYVARLAKEHLVSPSALLHRCLEWWDVGEPHHVGRWRRRTTNLLLRPAINAHSVGVRWIDLLEKLTGHQHIGVCTMVSWAGIFPRRQLLRDHLAWCPRCWEEEMEPYDRLLHCMRAVGACTKHGCRLKDRCAECGNAVPVIHPRSAPGRCPRCGGYLHLSGVSVAAAFADELSIAATAETWLVEVSSHPHMKWTRRSTPAQTIAKCMNKAGVIDAATLARAANVSRITAWGWLNGKSVPGFSETLRLCHVFSISVSAFLSGEVPATIRLRPLYELPVRSARRTARLIDEPKLAAQIAAYRSQNRDRPPSLTEVASAVASSTRVLRQHFPILCREIATEHRQFAKAQLLERRQALRATFETAIAQARARNIYARRAEIVSFLPQPGVLRSAQAREVFDQMLLELDPRP